MICDKIITDVNCNTIVQNEEFEQGYAYIYIFQLNKYDGSTIVQTFIRTDEAQQIAFSMGYDGYYTLARLKVTTNKTRPYYFFDGNIYNGNNIIPVQQIIDMNPATTGIELTYFQYFQICKLRKCFIAAAQKVLNAQTSIDCQRDKGVSKEDIYKRDLIWSALNVITYLVEMKQFEEAERLLERITDCNGLCDNSTKSGCGCSN